jgi:putative nucleotidyltransferase with HDIG domain
LLAFDKLDRPSATLAFGTLLHDIGKPSTFRVAERIRFDGHAEAGVEIARGILKRLKFSTEETEQILALVANHMKFKDVTNMRQSTLKRFLRMPKFDEHLALHRADCLASHGILNAYQFAVDHMGMLTEEQLRPERLLTGKDLIAAGYKPGPDFRTVLDEVETAQLDGTIKTHAEAWELANRLLKPSDAGHGRELTQGS